MSKDLECVLANERTMWAGLVEVDTGLADRFDDLSRQTEPHVLKGGVLIPRWEADSAFNPASSPATTLPQPTSMTTGHFIGRPGQRS